MDIKDEGGKNEVFRKKATDSLSERLENTKKQDETHERIIKKCHEELKRGYHIFEEQCEDHLEEGCPHSLRLICFSSLNGNTGDVHCPLHKKENCFPIVVDKEFISSATRHLRKGKYITSYELNKVTAKEFIEEWKGFLRKFGGSNEKGMEDNL